MNNHKILCLICAIWSAIGASAADKVYDIIVAKDGSGDYTSVQAAVDAVPEGNLDQHLIYIKAGTYHEHVFIPAGKSRLSIIGEGSHLVTIVDGRKSGGPEAVPVDEGATVVVHANDITFQGISFVNSHGVEANDGPQALAIYAKGDRIAFDQCQMLSYQDTYRTSEADNGRNYVQHSLVMGGVDFIYGNGNAWLDRCIIKINRKEGGWIVAPKHYPVTQWGYVFNHCVITADGNPRETSILLGRPWHHQPQTVWLHTRMEVTIPAEGWAPCMNGLPSVFAEYGSVDAEGRPLDLSRRITDYYRVDEHGDTIRCTAKSVLTAEEAEGYTAEAVMAGSDNWQPWRIFQTAESPIGYAVFSQGRLVAILPASEQSKLPGKGDVRPINRYGCICPIKK